MPVFATTEKDYLTEDDIADAKSVLDAFFEMGPLSDEQKSSVYYTQLSSAVPVDSPSHDFSSVHKEIKTICESNLSEMLVLFK